MGVTLQRACLLLFPVVPCALPGFDIDDSAPRFGVFRVWGGTLRLSRDLRMIWKTQGENP
jgi:hypothetical protein